MLRLAFVTPGVLPLLRAKKGTVYGGSELRAWRFARGLADLGFHVSIIALDREEGDAELLGPVSLATVQTRSRLLYGLDRFFGRNGATLAGVLELAAADVFIVFGVAEFNATVAEWCASHDRPCVLFAGSDADFSADYRPGNFNRNLWGSRCDRCYDSIKAATFFVVQTSTQQRRLRDGFGRSAEVIANPVPMPTKPPDTPIGSKFLWIGKAVSNKRPDVAVAVARACHDVSFTMVLNDVGNGLFEEISASAPPNIAIVPSVSPERIGDLFLDSRALLCTSDIEGFPNTFLDAGRFAVPVLSLSIDPDGFVARKGAGIVADGRLDLLIEAVKRFNVEPQTARSAGVRLFDYVKGRHDADDRVHEFADFLLRHVAVAPARVRGRA